MQIQVYTTFSVNTHQPYSTNGTAVPRENPQHDGYNKKLVYGVSIPVGVMLIIAFAMLLFIGYKWHRRKSQLQRDLTPYYACDQTEANVIDGVIYPVDSSSVDMICVAEDNQQDSGDESIPSPGPIHHDRQALLSESSWSKERYLESIDSVSV